MPPSITCPECGAAVTPPAGLTPGQAVRCPKCLSMFAADRPQRLRKTGPASRDEDEELEPARRGMSKGVVAAGVVVVLLVVAGGLVFAALQVTRERQIARAEAARAEAELARAQADATRPEPQLPKPPPPRLLPAPKNPANAARSGGLLGAWASGQPQSPAQIQLVTSTLSSRMIGTWKTKPGATPERVIEYRANGTYRDVTTGGPDARVREGTWKEVGVSGNKVLKIERTGGGTPTVRATFEDGELIHDGDQPGVTSILVKE